MRTSFAQRTALNALLLICAAARMVPLASAQSTAPVPPDKYAWLEDISGDKPLAWVKEHNERTATVLEKDPHFAPLQAEALTVRESPDRLAWPDFRGGSIYNFWQDAGHVRGIVRRTTLKDYLTADPKWETVLDYDALSAQDKKSWVAKDMGCLDPERERCLVQLSAGGEDAVTLREFDLKSGKFVEGVLPSHAASRVSRGWTRTRS